MDKAQVLKLIQTGDAAIKQAGLYETQLAAIEDARTKQAAEVSAAIPTAIDAMLAAKLIEPHEKAAAVAAWYGRLRSLLKSPPLAMQKRTPRSARRLGSVNGSS